MNKLLRVSDRHQITLPPSVMKDAGIAPGSYLEVRAGEGKIVLQPKKLADDGLSGAEWSKIDKLVKRQVRSKRYTEYAGPKEARKHLA
jgi:AbrB family looped-hinge helix DNA binding protein